MQQSQTRCDGILKKEDSLRKRYISKLAANLFSLAAVLATQAFITRGLGPQQYGDFTFLTNFFTEVMGFFIMGTSMCFYTKLSQRPDEQGLLSFYFYYVGLISLLILVFVALTFVSTVYTTIWPKQELRYIFLAAGFAILTFIVQVLNYMIDAYGLTVKAEIMKILQKFFGMLIIFLLFFIDRLNIASFFFYNYIVLGAIGVIFILIAENNGYSLKHGWRLTKKQLREYAEEFYHYSHPLFTSAALVLAVGIMDRWMVQVFSGSIQQGFYSLSYQIGTICFMFASSMIPLLTREFSVAYGNNNLPHMAHLFNRYIPMLYSITAYFSCFVAVQAGGIVHIFAGNRYQGAVLAVTIMAFYPLYQTLGQLSGAVFFAMGHMRLYRNIGVVFMLLSLAIAYFLLAPANMMGLNAGSTGLAIKMVLINILCVNVMLYFNARQLGINFFQYVRHQLLSVGFLLTLAMGTSFFVDHVFGLRDNPVSSFLVAGVCYSMLVACVAFYYPVLLGLQQKDIQTAIKYAKEISGMTGRRL